MRIDQAVINRGIPTYAFRLEEIIQYLKRGLGKKKEILGSS